jgi:hypothetical protein
MYPRPFTLVVTVEVTGTIFFFILVEYILQQKQTFQSF